MMMSRQRYSTRQQNQRGRGRGRQRETTVPSLQMESPRKRKRSPEPAPPRRADASGSSFSEARLTETQSAKVARVIAQGEIPYDDEDDDLDQLGDAALEHFELTQKEANRPIQPLPYSVTPESVAVSFPSSQWPHHPASTLGTTPQPNPTPSPTNSCKKGAVPSSTSPNLPPAIAERGSYAEQLRLLQEENYSKDGEVKLLRAEMQRLIAETAQRNEAIQKEHSSLLSEKKEREQQLGRENKSLETQLRFKEQELEEFRSKCVLLEQRVRSPAQTGLPSLSPVQTPRHRPKSPQVAPVSPRLSSGSRSAVARSGKVEFLSTESFMPLVKMDSAGEVPTVHVGGRAQTRWSGSGKTLEGRDNKSSPTDSSKRRGKTRKGSAAREKTRAEQSKARALLAESRGEAGDSRCIALDVPSRELSSTQLLMLLVQRDLLKVPRFSGACPSERLGEEDTSGRQTGDNFSPLLFDSMSSSSSVSLGSVSSSSSSSSCDPPNHRLTGLLSLLHLPSTQPRTGHLFLPGALLTPSLSSSPTSQPSSFPPHIRPLRLLPVLEAGTEASPRTPVRRLKLAPTTKALTCAQSDLSRVRSHFQAVGVVKSQSASNTPLRNPLLSELRSSSLVSGIDVKGLERGIVSLLHSADLSRLSVLSCAGFGRGPLPTSLSSRLSPSPDPSVLSMLHHIGDIIVHYYNDQTARSQPVNPNVSLVSDGGEHLDEMPSPKPSLDSSGMTTSRLQDLTPPPQTDLELISQALNLLETLATYCQSVREGLLSRPPALHFDSRPSSALGHHSEEEGGAGAGFAASVRHALSPLVTSMRAGPAVGAEGEEEGEEEEEEGEGVFVPVLQRKVRLGCVIGCPAG